MKFDSSLTSRIFRSGRAAVLVLGIFAFTNITASADDSKLSPELHRASGTKLVNVIVQYNVAPLLSHRLRVLACGGSVKQELGSVKGLKVSVPANRLRDLSKGPGVKYVSLDRNLSGVLNNSAPAVNAPYAWSQGFDASGIAVAMIDSC